MGLAFCPEKKPINFCDLLKFYSQTFHKALFLDFSGLHFSIPYFSQAGNLTMVVNHSLNRFALCHVFQ
jgi:hypothetical protein